jgi:hypothetical protein
VSGRAAVQLGHARIELDHAAAILPHLRGGEHMRSLKQFAVLLSLAAVVAASFAITSGELFTWAQATYADLFAGQPVAGRYEQYDYRAFPTGNYVAVDDSGTVSVLGPVSDNVILPVGKLSDFAAQVTAWEATQPASAYRGQVLIQAWNPDGSQATIQDFVNFTHYTINRWSMYSNYGLFPMGQPPASAQIGSDISLQNVDGIDFIAMDVPKNQTFYFTALWKAPAIGTVFMRADAQGAGYLIDGVQPQTLELPYDFALSEYEQARKLLAAAPPSAQAQALAAQAAAAVDAARNAPTASARAVASYTALSFVMPLKERLVLDASNAAIVAKGRRADFELNYEGFASWTDDRFVAGYASAADAGFSSVLTNIDWRAVSPSRGVYDFAALDYQVARANALGFKVALNVNLNVPSMPDWEQALPFDQLKAVYYEQARVAVSHFGASVARYYVASELELQTGQLTIDQGAELARQSLAGARDAAPGTPFGIYVSASAYVPYQMNVGANPSYRSGYDFMQYLADHGIRFDFMGLEMQYGTTFAPIDLQRFQQVLQETYDKLKLPIYMGETGYSSMTSDYGIASSFGWHDGLTEQSQADWADGTLRALYALPFVKGYYWVHLDADNNDYGSDYLSTLVGTGLLTASGSVKKVQAAFKAFDQQIKGLPAASP